MLDVLLLHRPFQAGRMGRMLVQQIRVVAGAVDAGALVRELIEGVGSEGMIREAAAQGLPETGGLRPFT